MSVLQWLIYGVLRGLVGVVFHAYYRRIEVRGRAHLQLRQPTLVVSNHPNALMDPLNVVRLLNRPVFFLANASLFKNPVVGAIFRYLYCIPVERHYDTGGAPINNEKMFEQAFAHLARGGNLYIAPEGGSFVGRKLLPLKTGTARIALGAEAHHRFGLGVQILPVGVTYFGGQRQFRTTTMVWAGAPIDVAPYAAAYAADERATVAELTALIATRLRGCFVACDHPAQEEALRCLEVLLQTEEPLSWGPQLDRSQQLLTQLQRLDQAGTADWADWQERAAAYQNALAHWGWADTLVAQPPTLGRWLAQGGALLLTLPLALYGWLNNLAILHLPTWLYRRGGLIPEYQTTVAVVVGLVLVLVCYPGQGWLLAPLLGSWLGLYLLSLPLTGWLAWHWWAGLGRWRAVLRWYREQDAAAALVSLRQELKASWHNLSRP